MQPSEARERTIKLKLHRSTNALQAQIHLVQIPLNQYIDNQQNVWQKKFGHMILLKKTLMVKGLIRRRKINGFPCGICGNLSRTKSAKELHVNKKHNDKNYLKRTKYK